MLLSSPFNEDVNINLNFGAGGVKHLEESKNCSLPEKS